ncbi:MAG: hypothetical protein K2X93_04460 [Candidatus Obscuribacterales bacterium]|nr:hypothetical protein [Candidatus Obscuribacterales bacterium]
MLNRRNNQRTRAVLLAVSAILSLAYGNARADDTTGSAGSKLTTPTKPTLHIDVKTDAITLSDMRDVGLCVMQIKQQAINIYLEVTRKEIPTTADAEIADPNEISAIDLAGHHKYLATRPEWLVYYISTMEPIIHLFKEDVKDAESGVEKIIVPKGTKDRFAKLFDEYETSVAQLNEHVSNIYELIPVTDNNEKIAREAVKLFEVANIIEKGRREGFKLIQEASTKETEQVLPKGKTE